jgi:hypothetical protein
MKTNTFLQTTGNNTDSPIRTRALTDPNDSSEPNEIITDLIITSPVNGAMLKGTKGTNITIPVTGTVNFKVGGQNRNNTITSVKVRFGEGTFENATLAPNTSPLQWSLTISKTKLLEDIAALPITAQFFAEGSTPTQSNTPVAETTITIQVDSSAPVLTITSPLEVNTPNPPYNLTLAGTVTDALTGVDKVEVQVGTGPIRQASRPSATTWQQPIFSLPNLGDHSITVKAFDKVGNINTQTVIVKVVDGTPPTLNITSPTNGNIVTLADNKVTLLGTASDTQTGITSVEWALDKSTQFTLAIPKAQPNDWSTWSAPIPITATGPHQVRVRAKDAANNVKLVTVSFETAVSATDPGEIIDTTAYLDDLLGFATRRLKTPALSTPLVTRNLLVSTFLQSFTALSDRNRSAIAHQSVSQVRLCIEVLRKHLISRSLALPTTAESNYRQKAYEALLQNMGTSFEELRLVLGNEAQRKPLAGRLGLGDTTDSVNRLLLQSTELTEVNLEKRFGLSQTRDPLDPLVPTKPSVVQNPEVLTLKLAHLQALWKSQDDAAKSEFDTKVPVIDPNLISEQNFRTRIPEDKAFGLLLQRQQFVTSELARIRQLRESQSTAINGFNTIITNVLNSINLESLDSRRQSGEDIQLELKASFLSLSAFLYLVRIRKLANTGTVLDSEWSDVYAILVQVQKLEQFDTWRNEEGTLTIGPDDFQLSSPGTPKLELPQFLASPQARQSWLDTLESRINQKQTAIQAWQTVVESAEAATLPLLRDALLEALRLSKETTIAAANRLTRALAIDCNMSGNQKTTRVQQALETLQTLIFAVRTGRFVDQDPAVDWELVLSETYTEDDFDEEWQWMGTFATWRSAMFVFLRPETMLLPTFRQHQTPAFRTLTNELRSNRRLTPERARTLAEAYSDYYRDICTLKPEASCQSQTRISGQRQKELFYLFGSGSTTGKVYWSVSDPQDTSDYAQTFWDEVPGFGKMEAISGAVPYQTSSQERFIYLFAKGSEKGQQKLFFSRYDLERLIWDNEPTVLELPETTGIDAILAVQRQTETAPPELFIRSPRARYFRSLNLEGNDWQTGNSEESEQGDNSDWDAFKVKEIGYPASGAPIVKAIHAVLKTTDMAGAYWLCMTKTNTANKLHVEKWSDVFTGRITVANSTFSTDGSFLGAFQWSAGDEFLLFHSTPGGKFYRQIAVNNTGSQKTIIAGIDRVVPSYGLGTGNQRHIASHRTGTSAETGNYRSRFNFANSTLSEAGTAVRVTPTVSGPFEITEQISESDFLSRKVAIEKAFKDNPSTPRSLLTYLEEAYYFVPVQLALQLQQQGLFTTALDWFQTVYAYNLPIDQRKIYFGLKREETLSNSFDRSPNWLLSGLNPHDIATSRANAYTRFTVLSLIRCFLDFADAEFTRSTAESIAVARPLYMAALELLSLSELKDPASPLLPTNLVLQVLTLQAELNLAKIRNGLNIAGLERPLEAEFQQSDAIALPTFGSNGSIRISPPALLRPTAYRYAVLIERSKQLVAIAQQVEAAFLSTLEKLDAESYSLLRARQDIQLSRSGVRLQDLRIREAEGGVKLSVLQQQRTQIQADHFKELIDKGFSLSEQLEIAFMITSAALSTSAAVIAGGDALLAAVTFGLAGNGDAASSLASAASTTASIFSTLASFERRAQEWRFQLSLSQQDIRIGNQQIKLAEDHLRITGQERFMAEMQTDHAEATMNFLANKFTNAELFDWMSGILEQVYRYFLQQATAMAKLAETQLAFERQDIPPALIQADYWEVEIAVSGGNNPDRRGLTGSVRLLQDITKLDQFAFETDKRKLQLTKTISLAQLSPVEFQQFRETGVMEFLTPMELFDRDFPGHHLRLIKRVRTSVIALIPPNQGIRATLSSTGISRVVAGSEIFEEHTVVREAQSVALSSPIGATGLFELDLQSELLLPFEGLGVDTNWKLSLPKAANLFDYNTIADVLITIEYTALDSSSYRSQVIQRLNPNFSADRAFSLRNQFPDQWYDLHNPEQISTPLTVKFNTLREDFPPNLDDLSIQQVVMYFARSSNAEFVEVEVKSFNFKEEGSADKLGGTATSSLDDIISTRRDNASNWAPMIGKSPFGEWELSFPDTAQMREIFAQEQFEDILFVITYQGRSPAWPA